jgi:hypothetical protein
MNNIVQNVKFAIKILQKESFDTLCIHYAVIMLKYDIWRLKA